MVQAGREQSLALDKNGTDQHPGNKRQREETPKRDERIETAEGSKLDTSANLPTRGALAYFTKAPAALPFPNRGLLLLERRGVEVSLTGHVPITR